MIAAGEKRLRLWQAKEEDGVRVPVDIYTDDRLTILRIQIGDVNLSLKDLAAKRGNYGVHRDDADLPGRAGLFSDVPCWFPECEELRARFHKELDTLNATAEAAGRPCLPCDRADLKRKYVAIMRHAGYPEYPLTADANRPGQTP